MSVQLQDQHPDPTPRGAAAGSPEGFAEVELHVSGMTCGSCAARVQKVLGRQTGVTRAAVNFATERATVA